MKFPKSIVRNLAPVKQAKALLPAHKVWCGICHKAVERKHLADHNQHWKHRLGTSKLRKLDTLAKDMWVSHRGAALSEERANSDTVDAEIERFRASQAEREKRF